MPASRLRLPMLCLAMSAAGSALAVEPAASAGVGVTAAHSLKLILGLLVVLAVILGCGWAAKRLPIVRSQRNGALRVIETISIGTRERMLLVDVEGTRLVVGVGAAGMTCLHVLGAADRGPSSEFDAHLRESLQAGRQEVSVQPGAAA